MSKDLHLISLLRPRIRRKEREKEVGKIESGHLHLVAIRDRRPAETAPWRDRQTSHFALSPGKQGMAQWTI